jgi:hypothetical protein
LTLRQTIHPTAASRSTVRERPDRCGPHGRRIVASNRRAERDWDASLFVAAELTGARTVFTLDNDFRIYRFDDGGFFVVVPE